MDPFENWIIQVRKGILEVCILNALEAGERYGYDLVKELADTEGLGVTEGTLYPLLSRLRVQGLLQARLEESSSGPARKYYSLTRRGHRTAGLMNGYLAGLVRGSQALRKKGTDP